MKSVISKKAVLMLLALSTTIIPALTRADGHGAGNGGDGSEARFIEIQTDIVTWINAGGSESLVLPAGTALSNYKDGMSKFLAPHATVVSFTDEPVKVADAEKTCKNFISDVDHLPHILCNIKRFKETPESAQYTLVHHEFAGLAGLEKSEGASSDYQISNQITDFLQPVTVLKLAIKRSVAPTKPSTTACQTPNPDAKLLFDAIQQGNAGLVSDLLESKVIAVDAVNENCEKALELSIQLRNDSVFSAIMDHYSKNGIKIEYTAQLRNGENYRTAAASRGTLIMVKAISNVSGGNAGAIDMIFPAVATNTLDVVIYLIDSGADIHALSADRETTLVVAATSNTADVVERLIQKGVDINAADDSAFTALMAAAMRPLFPEVLEKLIKAGADINLRNSNGNTALCDALQMGSLTEVNLLIQAGADMNSRDKNGTPLLAYVKPSMPDALDLLIRAGANVNIQDPNGVSILMNFSAAGKTDFVATLIKAGADLNAKDSSGQTALYYALEGKTRDAFKLLIAAGADINAADNDGYTALMMELTVDGNADESVVYSLIGSGSVNASGNDSSTALMVAAAFQPIEVIQALIAAGADKEAKLHGLNSLGLLFGSTSGNHVGTWNGDTAYDIAKHAKRGSEILKLLKPKHCIFGLGC